MSRKHPFPKTTLTRQGRFAVIDRWAAQRMGVPPRQAGMAEIRARLPQLGGLRYKGESSSSPLGGRIDPHLRHVEEVEALERIARANRFLRGTATPERRRPARTAGETRTHHPEDEQGSLERRR